MKKIDTLLLFLVRISIKIIPIFCYIISIYLLYLSSKQFFVDNNEHSNITKILFYDIKNQSFTNEKIISKKQIYEFIKENFGEIYNKKLSFIKLKKLHNIIQKNPKIAKVSLEYQRPNILKIYLKPRIPIALIGDKLLIDKDGYIFNRNTHHNIPKLLHLKIPKNTSQIKTLTSQKILNLVKKISIYSKLFSITAIEILNKNKAKIFLKKSTQKKILPNTYFIVNLKYLERSIQYIIAYLRQNLQNQQIVQSYDASLSIPHTIIE